MTTNGESCPSPGEKQGHAVHHLPHNSCQQCGGSVSPCAHCDSCAGCDPCAGCDLPDAVRRLGRWEAHLKPPRGWALSPVRLKVATWLLVLAAISTLAWMAGWALDPDLAWSATSFISEYGAASRPSGGFFRFTDLIGGCAAAGGVMLVRRHTPFRFTDWCIGALGVLTAGEFFFPMSCSPAVDSHCTEHLVSFDGAASDLIHEIVSALAVLAMAAALLSARRTPRIPAPLRRVGVLTLMALVSVIIATVIQVPPAGVAQAVLLFLWAVWLAWYAWVRADRYPTETITLRPGSDQHPG